VGLPSKISPASASPIPLQDLLPNYRKPGRGIPRFPSQADSSSKAALIGRRYFVPRRNPDAVLRDGRLRIHREKDAFTYRERDSVTQHRVTEYRGSTVTPLIRTWWHIQQSDTPA